MRDPRSEIPSIDSLLTSAAFEPLVVRWGRVPVLDATRSVVEGVRRALPQNATDDLADPERWAGRVRAQLAARDVPSLRRVINATGVVLHTNLGRAPLAAVAVDAMRAAAAEYTNLEYDLDGGTRGSRYTHCVDLLTELSGAEDALVVNNAAGALMLAVSTLAFGRGVVVSRGELIEIGGGFRIPEVLERAGARLVEVGSTNRTRLEDYRAALARNDVGALLKVHRSNFRISGFTEEASIHELAGLAVEGGCTLVHDLGSGLLVDPEILGLPPEPTVLESLEAGADVVTFSGDKLLGGPQAGVVVGRTEVVDAMRANPLCRALRVDKVTLAGLEATLRLYRDRERVLRDIPTLRMLATPVEALEARSRSLVERLRAVGIECSARPCTGAVGGGTFPEVELTSWGVAVAAPHGPDGLSAGLRRGEPPVIARIVEDELVLDVRTLLPGQDEELVSRLAEAWSAAGGGS